MVTAATPNFWQKKPTAEGTQPSIYLVHASFPAGITLEELSRELQGIIGTDQHLEKATNIDHAYKIVGSNEIFYVVRATNNIFLEQVLEAFQNRIDIEVTPVIELS